MSLCLPPSSLWSRQPLTEPRISCKFALANLLLMNFGCKKQELKTKARFAENCTKLSKAKLGWSSPRRIHAWPERAGGE